MRKVEHAQLRETLYEETLENGLTVYLLPKPSFAQVQAMFTTDYGSIDSHFRLAGEPDAVDVPDGIAHFLEHKMFESKDESVFTKFARYGASMNAFTSFSQTTYYFSSTDHIYVNLRTLLDFVQDPYFTEENVNKEKGIIEQEIRMGDDNPDKRAYYGLLRALYHRFPLRVEIAGTVESIYQIDKDALYRCYNTFYHPSNMILCVAGGFDPAVMMAEIRANQEAKSIAPTPAIERIFPVEPASVYEAESVLHLSVSQPRLLLGWKDATVGLSGKDLLAQDMLTSIILDALFGRSSPLYHELIDAGLIDQQFSWEYEITPRFGYSIVGGNTADPNRLREKIREAVAQLQANGVPEVAFERCRRKMMGWFLTMFDSPGQIARYLTGYRLRQANVFDTLPVLESITLADANRRLREHFAPQQCAASIVLKSD